MPGRAAPRSDTGSRALRGPPHPAEREQVVDQRLHPDGAVDRVADVLVGLVVQLARIAARPAAGRSSPPCAAAPAGHARRRRRTAPILGWTVAGPPSWPPGSRARPAPPIVRPGCAPASGSHPAPRPASRPGRRVPPDAGSRPRPPDGRRWRTGAAAGSPTATGRMPARPRWPATRPRSRQGSRPAPRPRRGASRRPASAARRGWPAGRQARPRSGRNPPCPGWPKGPPGGFPNALTWPMVGRA